MELGAFSISLTVKDIQASKAFYEKLGFPNEARVAKALPWSVRQFGVIHIAG